MVNRSSTSSSVLRAKSIAMPRFEEAALRVTDANMTELSIVLTLSRRARILSNHAIAQRLKFKITVEIESRIPILGDGEREKKCWKLPQSMIGNSRACLILSYPEAVSPPSSAHGCVSDSDRGRRPAD